MFLTPFILTGLAAAAVPLVIHLLARARFRSVDWAGMMFLDGSSPPQQQTAHLKGAALLILRMACVALLAVALAQPVLHSRGLGVRDGRASTVILLDRSASMAMDDNGRSRLNLAKETAYRVLGDAGSGLRRKGDEVSLVLLGAPEPSDDPAAVAEQQAADRQGDPAQAVASRVQALNLPAGQADVARGLDEALSRLEHATNPGREIYVICDRQALSWQHVDDDFISSFRRRVAAWPVPPTLFVLPVGSDSTDNVAIESMRLLTAPAIADQPAEIEVKLHNYGPIPRAGLPLAITVTSGGWNVTHKPPVVVNVPAYGATTVRIPITFAEGGSHLIVADLARAPGIPFGKHFEYAIDVLEPLRALIITGDEREKTFRSSTDFIRLALSPYKGVRRDLARVEVRAADDWVGVDLDSFQIVVLADVADLTAETARSLTAYVYGGGGLLIAPGDLVHQDEYNELLGREGRGILPAELAPEQTDSDLATTSLDWFDLTDPIFDFLRGRPDAGPPPTVQRYFPATALPGAKLLAKFANGDPFLIASAPGTIGRGRVLLVTASLDADASTLPLTGLFLPFMQSAARYLVGGERPERNLEPGHPLVADFNEPIETKDDKAPRLRLPNGTWVDSSKLQIVQSGARSEIRYAAAHDPGAYLLQVHVPSAKYPVWTWFVLASPTAESDLTPLTDDRWRSLEQGLGFARLEGTRRSIVSAQTEARGGRPLWLPLLAGVMGLSLIELAAARRWCIAQ